MPTVSERSAGALLREAPTLTAERPMTLTALESVWISFQHARIMCDETANLEPAAAAVLEAHFLDPDVPGYARGCFAGELAPGRFRAKARYWRKRHHPVSIETRHRNSVKYRRLEYAPDRTGPERHGLALGLSARGPGGRNLGPRHKRRPVPAGG